MNIVDWNNATHVAWMCEQAGIDFKGLPLSHQDKQKLLAITQRRPFQEIPKFTQRKPKEIKMTQHQTVTVTGTSTQTETALLSQYDRELQGIEERRTKYAKAIKDLAIEAKNLAKKRAAVARVLGVVK